MIREENFDTTEELWDLTKNNGTETNRYKKKRARTFFSTKSTKELGSGTGKILELNKNFFLEDNVDHKQNVIDNQKIIPKKTIKKINLEKLQSNKS